MRTSRHPFTLMLLAFSMNGFAQNQSPHPPAKKMTYERFTMVRTRNIFDPDRVGNAPITSAPKPTTPTAADYAALTGTLVTADKVLAFFSGSRPEFNKVLALREEIAGATLTQITPNSIVIERAGKATTVTVGQTVPLDANATPTAAPVNTAPTASTSASAPAANNPALANKEDIIRRMMEKRQQELK